MGKSLKIDIFTSVKLFPSNYSCQTICAKLFHNPVASCSLRNFDFLLLHTKHFDETIILPFLDLATFDFYFLYFFYTSNNIITLFY